MSQYDFGNLESPLSGTALINTHLEPWRDALHSCHKGSSTPSYAAAGMIWVNDSATPWVVYMYDGADNIQIGTVNATTNVFTPSGTTSEWCGTSGGTANAQTLTPTVPRTAYNTGDQFECIIGTTNTSETVTFNVSSLGTKNVKAFIGVGKVAIPIGALQAGAVARLVYDGTDLVLLNVRANNQGADVASSGTLNLDTATGDYVHVTGTTTITAITLSKGQERTVVFDGALTLTNGASLLNIGAANITTVAGDVARFRGEASGVVRMVGYHRKDGTSLGDTAVVAGYSKQQYAAAASITSSSNHIAWNLDSAQAAKHTATENTTLDNPTNMKDGATYTFIWTQHASAAKTLAFGSAYKWPGGVAPVVSTTVGAKDIFTFYSDGTNMYGVCQKAFA